MRDRWKLLSVVLLLIVLIGWILYPIVMPPDIISSIENVEVEVLDSSNSTIVMSMIFEIKVENRGGSGKVSTPCYDRQEYIEILTISGNHTAIQYKGWLCLDTVGSAEVKYRFQKKVVVEEIHNFTMGIYHIWYVHGYYGDFLGVKLTILDTATSNYNIEYDISF